MADVNIAFSNMMLKMAKQDAKEAKIKIGKLTTWFTAMGNHKHYEVYEDGDMVWEGTAYCASEAKGKYITSRLPEEK